MDRMTAMHAYVRLVELDTFSAVAEELRVSQSTVSKWLAALEDELGVQLMERTTRSRRVTEAGERFYQRARDILAAYADASAELAPARSGRRARAREPLRGRIRVSVPVVYGRLFILPKVAKFMRRHPAVEVELVFNDRYVNLVEDNFDVAVRVGIPVDVSFKARKLGESRRHLVASPGYLERGPALTRPEHLREHCCLVHTNLRVGDTWVLRRGQKTWRAPVRGRFAANNSEALLTLARRGIGVALLADWLVEADLRAGRLRTVLPDYELPPAPVQALTAPGRHPHPRVRAFLDFLSPPVAGGG